MALTLPQYPARGNNYRDFPEAFADMNVEEVLELAGEYVKTHTKCFWHCRFATFLVAEAMFEGILSARQSAKCKYRYFSRLAEPTMEDLPYSIKLLAFHLR